MKTNNKALSYEVEVEKIESLYSGAVELTCKEADWQKRRDEADARRRMEFDKKRTPKETMRAHIREYVDMRREPRYFRVTLAKEEAMGFAIGSRVRVTVELA